MKQVYFPHRSIMSSFRSGTLTASIGLIGGIGLQSVKQELLLIVPMLIALPALNAMVGDYATLITSHLGDPESNAHNRKTLYKSLIICVPISAIGVIAVSIFLAVSQGYIVDRSFVLTYSAFVLLSFSIVIGTVVAVSLSLHKYLLHRGLNSDDVLIPTANVVASVLMLLCVTYAAWQLF